MSEIPRQPKLREKARMRAIGAWRLAIRRENSVWKMPTSQERLRRALRSGKHWAEYGIRSVPYLLRKSRRTP